MKHEPDEDERAEMASAARLRSMFREWEYDVASRYFWMGLDKGFEKGLEMGDRRTMSEGFKLGSRAACFAALINLYEARFDCVPLPITQAIIATRDTTQLQDWIILFGTGSHGEIVAAVLGDEKSGEPAGEP